MVWEDFKHLFSNMIHLKRVKFIYSLIYILIINSIYLCYNQFKINLILTLAFSFTFFVMALRNLLTSVMIPINTKDKSKTTQYSTLYIYSLVQSFYSILLAVTAEATINGLIISLVYFSINLSYGNESITYFQFLFIVCLFFNFIYLVNLSQALRRFKLRVPQINFTSEQLDFAKGIIPLTCIFFLMVWFLRIEHSKHFIENHYGIALLILFIALIYGSYTIYNSDKLKNPREAAILKLEYNIPLLILSFWLSDPLYLFHRKNQLIVFNVSNNNLIESSNLLNKQPDLINVKDETENRSLLYIAVKNSNVDMAKLLIDKGADINEINEKKMTLLHFASLNCSLGMVQLLLDRGLNINAVSSDNRNALFYASKNYCTPLIIYFNKTGINRAQIDRENNNYVTFASKYNRRFKNELPLLKSLGVILP